MSRGLFEEQEDNYIEIRSIASLWLTEDTKCTRKAKSSFSAWSSSSALIQAGGWERFRGAGLRTWLDGFSTEAELTVADRVQIYTGRKVLKLWFDSLLGHCLATTGIILCLLLVIVIDLCVNMCFSWSDDGGWLFPLRLKSGCRCRICWSSRKTVRAPQTLFDTKEAWCAGKYTVLLHHYSYTNSMYLFYLNIYIYMCLSTFVWESSTLETNKVKWKPNMKNIQNNLIACLSFSIHQ